MTGTINPDGTVGPVGGIPEKVAGAADKGIKTVLIPVGQRNSAEHAGQLVDVVDLGRRKGVEVREVKDVYEAYQAFTGDEPAQARRAAATHTSTRRRTAG